MGFRPCVLSACLYLLSRSRTHQKKQVFIACGALQRVWRRNFIHKRLVKLWQEIFCYGCETHLEEKEATENSGVEELGKKKQKRNDSLCRRRTARILHRVPSSRNAFNRVSSWSHYVEESIASELSAAISAVEADSMVDMSQLFLGEKFASGAHSRLYHGIYKNRAVAVKLIMPPQEDAELSSRLDRQFSQEVTLLSQLRHGNVIEFVAACKKPPVYCVITEYLPGGSLKAFLHKSEPHALSMKLVTRIALDVARGMEYLHSQGVMHRDLKSDNLIITDDFHVKIADFGVSCLETHRKSMKGFMGTYRWMAPEMIKQKTCSRKVDVYSFGIVLWELCTGLIPFGEMTPVQAAFAICQEKARPPIPGHCPKELAKLMQLCWSCNPARRPEFSWIVKNLERFDQMQAE